MPNSPLASSLMRARTTLPPPPNLQTNPLRNNNLRILLALHPRVRLLFRVTRQILLPRILVPPVRRRLILG